MFGRIRTQENFLCDFGCPCNKGIHYRLVAQVGVLVPHEVEHVEGHGQEARADEVPEGREVRDGRIVGVNAHLPHPVHHHHRHVQQNYHLGEKGDIRRGKNK